MNFRGIIALSLLFPVCLLSYGQTEDEFLRQLMEHIAGNVSEDFDYSEIAERLHQYRKHPLDINKVSAADLRQLMFMSPVQIDNLLSHRDANGLFIDVLELQGIRGFDLETVRWLSGLLVVVKPGLFENIPARNSLKESRHDLMIRFGQIIQKQKGYTAAGDEKPVYSGSPLRMFTRYRFNYENRILASLNIEKDGGEGFSDFYSASVSLNGDGVLRKLVLGDYALQFGQGLTMWSGMGFGKGAALNTLAKQDGGLRPYSSANESSFLRGISARMQYGSFSFTPFVSYRKLDGGLSDDRRQVSSLNISGLHRTTAELNNKNSFSQLVFGAHGQYEGKRLRLGLTAYRTGFNIPFAAGNVLYEKYDFQGRSLINTGIHYHYTFRNTYLFGEAAHSLSSGFAYVNGLMSSLSNQVSLVLLHRRYARDYHSFFNQGISESTEAVNEGGFYSGLLIKFDRKWEFRCYSDFFRFPWLKFRVDAPSAGYEMLGQLTYEINKQLKVTARYKQQLKQENAGQGEDGAAAGLDDVQKGSYRIELNYRLSNSLTLRNRAEMSSYRKESVPAELGFLSYQDLIYDPMNSRLSGNLRFAIFDTPGFNSRIYAFENDVLYSYSVPAYQNKGLRCYLNLRYTASRNLDIWFRYATLGYTDQDMVGSGNDSIQGRRRTDVRLQLRYQF